jgi:hypothetical protein
MDQNVSQSMPIKIATVNDWRLKSHLISAIGPVENTSEVHRENLQRHANYMVRFVIDGVLISKYFNTDVSAKEFQSGIDAAMTNG